MQATRLKCILLPILATFLPIIPATPLPPLNVARFYGCRCCYVDHVKHECNMFSPIKVAIDRMHEDNDTLTYPISPGADAAVVQCCCHRQRRMTTLAAEM